MTLKDFTDCDDFRQEMTLAERRSLLEAARFTAKRADDHAAHGRTLEEEAARSLAQEFLDRALEGSSLAEIEPAGHRVLLVEDEYIIATSLAHSLQAAGFVVHCESEGRAALQSTERIEPAAAIVDLGLPDCSGDYVAHQLRARFPKIPIIVYTGYSSPSISESLARGGISIVEKPVDESRLIRLLLSSSQA